MDSALTSATLAFGTSQMEQVMGLDTTKYETEMKRRAEERERNGMQFRPMVAQEGIYDELTKMNLMLAAIYAKLK